MALTMPKRPFLWLLALIPTVAIAWATGVIVGVSRAGLKIEGPEILAPLDDEGAVDG